MKNIKFVTEAVNLLSSNQLNDTLIKASMNSVLCSNNIKHVHYHSAGAKFKDIHELGDEYYAKMSEDTDFLFELGEEAGVHMPNPTYARSFVDNDYQEDYTEDSYEYPSGIIAYQDIIRSHITALVSLKDYVTEDISSSLDEMIRYWNKEVDYRLAKRVENL